MPDRDPGLTAALQRTRPSAVGRRYADVPRIPAEGGRASSSIKYRCRVTGASLVTTAGNLQWKYTVAEVRIRRLDSGPIEDVLVSGGFASSEVYDDAEIINPNASGSTSPYGNMVYPDQLTDGGSFTINRVPDGTVVWVYLGTLDIDTTVTPPVGDPYVSTERTNVYWMTQANPVGGSC